MQGNWNFWSVGFDLHDSISEQYLFLTSAMEIRVCQNPGAMHEPMLSDVHIGENVSLHNNGVTTLYDSCNQRDVQTEQ